MLSVGTMHTCVHVCVCTCWGALEQPVLQQGLKKQMLQAWLLSLPSPLRVPPRPDSRAEVVKTSQQCRQPGWGQLPPPPG